MESHLLPVSPLFLVESAALNAYYFISRTAMKRSGMKAKYSPTERSSVTQVEFVVMPQDLLEKWSVAEIKEPKLYEGSKPARDSPNDLRLGVSSQDQKCETCGETKECQGHFGHIRLAQPVFHFGYLKYIQKILKCVCHNCYKIKICTNEAQRRKLNMLSKIQNPVKKLNEITKLLHNIKECVTGEGKEGSRNNGCGSPIPTKIYLRNYRIYVEDMSDTSNSVKRHEKPYERSQIRKILEELSNQPNLDILGFTSTRPIDLMIRILAVPPPQIRPSIEMNPEKKAEDDITTAYVKILNINQEILKNNGQSVDKNSKIDELERTIAAIMIKLDRHKLEKSSNSMNKKKAIKNLKSISDRLKGKEGRFRQNLMGKRVDFSARSVVSPDSNLALDELGVPEKVASRLTVPEEVTEWNYERIKTLCKQGKVHVLLKPSEDRLRDDEKPINISKLDESEIEKYLNYGMIAERCLQNGDYVLFNRQPTLHRMSMMGHRVKILPFNTFRLNLSVCTPYNADFDGDEMNMHVPQSFETIAELKHIAHVPKQIVAPKNNAPVMGIVQDALLGVYLFTMRDTFLTREEIMNLIIWIDGGKEGSNFEDLLPGELPLPAILKPEPLWTGKQVMSLIIPKKITIEIKKGDQPLANVQDISMIIKKGELVTGALQKEVVGSGAGGLVHSIWLQIGPDATNEFMTVVQRIVNNWLISNSFTVGASDVAPSVGLDNEITADRENIEKLYYEVLDNYRDRVLLESKNMHQRGKKVVESFEFNINSNLNNRLTKAQDGVKMHVFPYLNNIYKMIAAKSKGSETNLAQIMFLVGNQNVDGKRCPLGFSKRALPHFVKDDNSPEPRGFVFSSFYKGLKPHEFFFHSMGGREGLSDTAVKTSRTGYIQRKLVKSLEDLVIKYDGSVRDSQKNFLQKMYGEDGFLSEYIERQRFNGAEMGEEQFKKEFRWTEAELLETYNYKPEDVMKLNEEYSKLLQARKRTREILINGKDATTAEYYSPIKIERLINRIKSINYGYEKEVVDPLYVYEKVEELIEKLVPPQSQRKYQEILKNIEKKIWISKKGIEKKIEFEKESGIELFRIHLRHNLSSKKLCNFTLSKAAFNGLLEEIEHKFYQALAQAGESIGSIAAQSIGEPTTQMTLNTFHLAGVSDKNVTLGVPRLQELLDCSKNIKTPNMCIFIKQPILDKDKNKEHIRETVIDFVMHSLPERHLRDYLESSRFYYDPDPYHSKAGFPYSADVDVKRTPWVINLEFNNKKISSKPIWVSVTDRIRKEIGRNFEVLESREYVDTKSENPQLMLRLLETNEPVTKKDEPTFSFLARVEAELKNLSIGGISGIKTAKIAKRFIMNAPLSSRTNLNNTEKAEYEYVVFETDGTNLRECLSHPQIDPVRTYSNDMNEIYNTLGIEAARQCFINEFKEIIKPYGIYVNHRHLSVLTDWMSMRGTITPVNRNGINRVKDVSVLRKASYEETAEILFGAAVFSEKDNLKGVSEKVIFGQPVEMGTSSFKIMIDTEMVSQYVTKASIEKKNDMNIYGEAADYSDGLSGGYLNAERTPMMNTPNPYEAGGTSVLRSMRSPGAWASPGFTPAPGGRDMMFTPMYEGGRSDRSPAMTPINIPSAQTPLQSTPFYTTSMGGSNMSPAPSYYNRSEYKSPSYILQYNSPNSPSYSYNSSMRNSSQSPSYSNSPMESPYSHSPSYSPVSDGNRRGNASIKQDEDEHENDNEDEVDDF